MTINLNCTGPGPPAVVGAGPAASALDAADAADADEAVDAESAAVAACKIITVPAAITDTDPRLGPGGGEAEAEPLALEAGLADEPAPWPWDWVWADVCDDSAPEDAVVAVNAAFRPAVGAEMVVIQTKIQEL